MRKANVVTDTKHREGHRGQRLFAAASASASPCTPDRIMVSYTTRHRGYTNYLTDDAMPRCLGAPPTSRHKCTVCGDDDTPSSVCHFVCLSVSLHSALRSLSSLGDVRERRR